MKNFVQKGDTLPLVAPYARLGGEGALIGALFAVAVANVDNAVEGEFTTRGVYDLTALSSDAGAQGAKVYWDNTNKRCTVSASGNTLIGALTKAKVADETTMRVRLNGTV
jgi:predicted RecA/RadA family phage recombinase